MAFWDFTFSDFILALSVLISIIVFVIPYRARNSPPTRADFLSFKRDYEQHLLDDKISFADLKTQVSGIAIQAAVLLERIDNVRETLKNLETQK
jgi:hypothetical protein